MSPDTLAVIHSAVEFLFAALILGVGGWALRQYIATRTEIPRAENGFLTMDQFAKHCESRHSMDLGNFNQHLDLLNQQMVTLTKSIDRRLDIGDKQLADHTLRLMDIEKDLVSVTAGLKGFENGFCDKVFAIVRKAQKPEEI